MHMHTHTHTHTPAPSILSRLPPRSHIAQLSIAYLSLYSIARSIHLPLVSLPPFPSSSSSSRPSPTPIPDRVRSPVSFDFPTPPAPLGVLHFCARAPCTHAHPSLCLDPSTSTHACFLADSPHYLLLTRTLSRTGPVSQSLSIIIVIHHLLSLALVPTVDRNRINLRSAAQVLVYPMPVIHAMYSTMDARPHIIRSCHCHNIRDEKRSQEEKSSTFSTGREAWFGMVQ
ncbi:hypothetical protein OH76DRAFT_23686 [Lentinus brumalis]|uniref:Uncharacterized protein n=1 Tax=Lentinus brumalis TaxID=2498619 RepID=A0A371DXH5_9APHY|nr:hypothetical protein OH76DRAFT_23686 [Polyporus brumalis]